MAISAIACPVTLNSSNRTSSAELGAALLVAALCPQKDDFCDGVQPDAVPGLVEWLERLKLKQYASRASEWCHSLGIDSLASVRENLAALAEALALKPIERKRLCRDVFGPPEDSLKYAVFGELGRGATARVYRCSTRDNRMFAVKTVGLAKLQRLPNWRQVSDILYQEVTILLSLQHPRIVSLIDVVDEPVQLRLVMDLVEGGDLSERIADGGPLGEPEAKYVFLQMCEGLSYIHSRGIVHHDLKPDNVLIDAAASRSGRLEIKLSDFGHSQLVGSNASDSSAAAGTPLYAAPEVLDPMLAVPGCERSVDLWSLGVVLFLVLVGTCPFAGSGSELREQVNAAVLDFEVGETPAPSADAQRLVGTLIRVNPSERLAMNWCLAHPWVATKAGLVRHIMRLCDQSQPEVWERRYRLPPDLPPPQAQLLRRDLQRWTVKFRFSAIAAPRELVVNFGDIAQLADRQAEGACVELEALLHHHFGSLLPLLSGEAAPGQQGQRSPQARLPASRTASEAPQSAESSQKDAAWTRMKDALAADAPREELLSILCEGEASGLAAGDLLALRRALNVNESPTLTVSTSAGCSPLAPVQPSADEEWAKASRLVRETEAELARLMEEQLTAPRGWRDRLQDDHRRLRESPDYLSAIRLLKDPAAELERQKMESLVRADNHKRGTPANAQDLQEAEAALCEAEATAGVAPEEIAALRAELAVRRTRAALAEASASCDAGRLALAIAAARRCGALPESELEGAVASLQDIPHEAEARRRRLESRKAQKDKAKWNFSGKSSAAGVDVRRLREQDAALESRRRA